MLWRISALPASVAVLLAIRVAATPAALPPYCPEEPKFLERPYPPPPSPRPYVSPPKVYLEKPKAEEKYYSSASPSTSYPEKTKTEEKPYPPVTSYPEKPYKPEEKPYKPEVKPYEPE
jgi:hypothetical protein